MNHSPKVVIAAFVAAASLVGASMIVAQSNDAAKGKKIVYIGGLKGPYYGAVSCGARDVAEQYGVAYSDQEPDDFAPTLQIPILNAVVATKPDAILISATDTKALIAPLKDVVAKGIKVITVANGLTDSAFLTSTVNLNNAANGRATATMLARLLGSRKGKVAFISYQPGGSAIVDGRRAAFEAQIKRYPNLQYIGFTVNTGGFDGGAQKTNALVSANPDLIGIVGSNSYDSVGASTALRERGLTGKVVVVASDSDEDDVKAFKAGQIQGIVGDQWREQGRQAMLQAIAATTGQAVKKSVVTNPIVITSPSDPNIAKYTYSADCSVGK